MGALACRGVAGSLLTAVGCVSPGRGAEPVRTITETAVSMGRIGRCGARCQAFRKMPNCPTQKQLLGTALGTARKPLSPYQSIIFYKRYRYSAQHAQRLQEIHTHNSYAIRCALRYTHAWYYVCIDLGMVVFLGKRGHHGHLVDFVEKNRAQQVPNMGVNAQRSGRLTCCAPLC